MSTARPREEFLDRYKDNIIEQNRVVGVYELTLAARRSRASRPPGVAEKKRLQSVFSTVERITGRRPAGETAPYFTDAAVLGPAYSDPPFMILGPGEKEMAHQTDEYCVIERIGEAVESYRALAAK